MENTSNAGIVVPPEKTTKTLTPSCDLAKLCCNLSGYMDISGQLRAKRKEVYEADRRGKLKDQQALNLSVGVAKLKHLSDKMRLLVCEQLRALINEIHLNLYTTSRQTVDSDCTVSNELDTNNHFSLDLADNYTELLHSITITAVKEEIFEKERLLSNVRLHSGKSIAYIVQRSRWRFPLLPHSLSALFNLLPSSHKANDAMSLVSKQQLAEMRGDGFDGVRLKLLQLIKFHDTIGYVMNDFRTEQKRATQRPRDAEAEEVVADQRLMSCLRLTAAVNKEPKQEEQQSSVSYLLAKQVLESAQHSNEIAEEFKAQCAYLRTLSREQHHRAQASCDEAPWFFNLIVVVAIWYLFFR
ncbi:hypothetical protein Pcac1_g27911 [Phytophthora cactorum]|uniref:Uncharacterized protein n=1 Tax=Phytophthora cactorum TaxID=29920 RepID=A0A8T1BKI8_9STRA|nr:hypothetical protein Pcac1_g27911 [Phytophthora cactorum]KAG2803300.1 hypothetical protein PC111_g18744 [Phytophthora cactorum]KAG2904027.1 hypothetical protein PC117_g21125 [Phytophthora cactorum]KAG3047651.1 hypothetical protein PC121_g19937 [Phytophthora cactorum]KAG3092457.1 hypothetical protein PC122_g6532 [Phytophthora cactorum]